MFDPHFQSLSVHEIRARYGRVSDPYGLRMFNSYERTGAMFRAMDSTNSPAEQMSIFLDWGNCCDAPWPWRLLLADLLRLARAKISLADALPPEALSFYDSLPDLVPVWRGCEQGRERGLHWATDLAVAESFARGMRCTNENPTLVSAKIPKRHIFAVFVDRQESEIVLDPKRLRQLSAGPGPTKSAAARAEPISQAVAT